MNIQEIEQNLNDTVARSWERLRSSEELQAFLGRRELALATIKSTDPDDVI